MANFDALSRYPKVLSSSVQRAGNVSGDGTLTLTCSDAGHLLGEYDGSRGLVQETVWLGEIPVATLRRRGLSAAPPR